MNKQTAVEWLIKKLQNREKGIFDGLPHLSLDEIYYQAKEMEKQQRQIELPSDEEIVMQSKYIAHNYFQMHHANHYQGLEEGSLRMASWIKNKIQGGNNEQQ